MRLSCFGCENKNGGQEEELGKIIAKNMARTSRRQLEGGPSAIWRIFAELNNPKNALCVYQR